MKNLLIIIATIFSLNVVAQEPEYIRSDNQFFYSGQGEDVSKFAETEDEVYFIFRFEDKIIERYDPNREKSLVTNIHSVERIRKDIFEYRGIDEAGTPTVIQTYSDEDDNIIDIRVYFWSLYGPGEADDVFICISHEI
jgi:hypothetical protein